jgi:hypothetical protein
LYFKTEGEAMSFLDELKNNWSYFQKHNIESFRQNHIYFCCYDLFFVTFASIAM